MGIVRWGRRGLLAAAVLMASCASGGTGAVPGTDGRDIGGPGPAPGAMCPAGQHPVVAAYALEDGDLQWVACDPGLGMYVATAASADDVWVEVSGGRRGMVRLDARTGSVVARDVAANYPGDVPDGADVRRTSPPSTESVYLRGGQDDPLEGVDASTGEVVWTAIGFPVFDNVWAGDDGAVYVNAWDTTGQAPGSWLVAYVIDTGQVRWKVDAGDLSPWHAVNGRVFALGQDLHVLSASDGSMLWQTSYDQPSGYPRLFGVVTNDDAVFLSFTMVPSDGD